MTIKMHELLSVLIYPVIVGVILLIVEYFVIQPIRRKANRVSIPTQVSRDWAKAIEVAIKRFKAQQSGYVWMWWLPSRNKITLEEVSIQKGQATLGLAVWGDFQTAENPVPGVTILGTVAQIIARYELAIDRTGDILGMKPTMSQVSPERPSNPVRDLPPTTLEIKKREKPRVEKVNGGLKVIIEFEIENSGRAGKVCPYIEFQVVTMSMRGRYEPQSFSSDPKAYDISALAVMPFRFEHIFYPPDLPLIEPPHEVKIELYPYPNPVS